MRAPDFEAASKRHFADAEYLLEAARLPNSDHLVGFAAECALKALVITHLGGQVVDQFAYWPSNHESQGAIRHHLGGAVSLWGSVSALANTRGVPDEVRDLLVGDPFVDWEVSDRYASGEHLLEDVVAVHFEGARKVLVALESLKLSNMSKENL